MRWVPAAISLVFLCLFLSFAAGQELITLEQAGSRADRDLTAAYESRAVLVRGQICASPVWALGTYYLPLRDSTDHGLLLRGDAEQFNDLEPGDWIEAAGPIQSRAGLPLLAPSSIRKIRHDSAPEPKELSIAELNGFRYLGLLARVTGTITGIGENLGGKSLIIGDRHNSIGVFLPNGANAAAALKKLQVGDRVRVTGLATQYSLDPRHDGGFQIMLASREDIELTQATTILPPLVLLGALAGIALLVMVWWIRARRVGSHRQSMRAFHTLSEEIISAASPAEIAEKLVAVLPAVTAATGVRLYLHNPRTKSLESVPTTSQPDPMAVTVDGESDGLASGAVVCFKNRTLLNVPDVRRSPLIQAQSRAGLPRSAMFVPLIAQHGVMGVLEIGNARRLGYFTVEEQAAAQHLANQVAASLKLQEQHSLREQIFRGEKLAATGQLISGVANELRAPLESILRLSTSLARNAGRSPAERDLRMLADESLRASEIVARLVSFARPEDAAARQVDVNALMAGLMQFREPEWKTLGLRAQNRLSLEPALVLGAQGQIEQVFLNLLVHAEQSAGDAYGKSISIASSVIARRVVVEISYSASVYDDDDGADPFSDGRALEGGALGLGVCQGIVQTHGGEIRFRSRAGTARFEVDLPLSSQLAPARDALRSAAALTVMLVDPDAGGQRQLLGMLSGRGHRVVPAPAEEAADLAQRLHFDAIFWVVRPSRSRWSEFQERIQAHVPVFVLLSEGYDRELALSLESGGGFLLALPVQENDLDQVLAQIERRTQNSSTARR
jgi:signal transduction histidine kinase/CheY-like chemotaxis protein